MELSYIGPYSFLLFARQRALYRTKGSLQDERNVPTYTKLLIDCVL